MIEVRLVQIDAFADEVFSGNPAAVMPLDSWLPDVTLQCIAQENNLSETAFFTTELPEGVDRPNAAAYHLRWFTPVTEVDLCGHATLATAGLLFEESHSQDDLIRFWTRSGWVTVARSEGSAQLWLDFPAGILRDAAEDRAEAAVGVRPVAQFEDADLVLVAADADAVRSATPDFTVLAGLPVRGVIVTAPGDADGVDFVSRWFGAQAGLFEDPVTGSAHSQIAPYWAKRLGRTEMVAQQLSPRGGTVRCRVDGDRVQLGGTYRRYLDGLVSIPVT
jgi:PhzF family phenazine biosynthesis protein